MSISSSPVRSDLTDIPAAASTMDVIEIDGLRLRCVIGCREEERRDRSDVVIDLRIGVDARPAGISDRLADAWNYRTAAKAVVACVEESAFRTVEALASTVAEAVLAHGAPWVRVRLHKPGALRFADSVGIVIERAQPSAWERG